MDLKTAYQAADDPASFSRWQLQDAWRAIYDAKVDIDDNVRDFPLVLEAYLVRRDHALEALAATIATRQRDHIGPQLRERAGLPTNDSVLNSAASLRFIGVGELAERALLAIEESDDPAGTAHLLTLSFNQPLTEAERVWQVVAVQVLAHATAHPVERERERWYRDNTDAPVLERAEPSDLEENSITKRMERAEARAQRQAHADNH